MARPKGSGTIPIMERLKAKTKFTDDGCWLWVGSTTHNGYGEINTVDRKVKRVHRVSFENFHGPIPEGTFVLHRCDRRECWNPDHLFIGTPADNTADMLAKDRYVLPTPSPGEANGNALVTDDIVRSIRKDTRRIIDIAAEHGIHFTTVSDIRRRKSWKHVTD